jgi:hypothetical protein
MSAPRIGLFAALLVLAVAAIAEDVPVLPVVPDAPPVELPAAAAPAPPQMNDENVTFDNMESIPFENAVEPPDEPPVLDNTVKPAALDNVVVPPALDNVVNRPMQDNSALAMPPVTPPAPPSSFGIQNR